MIIGAIVAILVLVVYCIILLIFNHKTNQLADTVVNDFANLSVEYAEELIKNHNLKVELEESKDIIKKLSEEINLKTVKEEPKESEAVNAEPKKKTTRKTTTKKTTTKKKEVKE